MKRFQASVFFVLLLCTSLTVAACSGGSASGASNGSGASATATTAPTATPKPKPSAVPKITMAFCQGLMTVAEANQIMHPPTPATTIRVDAPASGGGSCNYEYKLYLSVVSVAFTHYAGGNGDAQSFLNTLAAQSTASVNPSIGKATNTPVTGVGDAAVFLTLSLPINKQAILHVVYGAVVITCLNPNVGSSPFATQQAALTQVCQQVISRM